MIRFASASPKRSRTFPIALVSIIVAQRHTSDDVASFLRTVATSLSLSYTHKQPAVIPWRSALARRSRR